METTQAIGGGLTFEQVWAIVQENVRGMKELRESHALVMKELRESHALEMKELRESQQELRKSQQETERQMRENDERLSKQLGKLGGRFGEMVEYMVMPNLVNKFRELDFVFTKAYPEAVIKDEQNNILTEIDITLENGDKVMIVEVKTKPAIQDITDHIERMEKVRLHADLHGDNRKYLGAVAGMVLKDNVREFALRTGFYVIEPSGDTFNIIKPEGKYQPREW